MAKKATVKKAIACTCPACGHPARVPGNGLYHCFGCGGIFSVDLAPMAKIPVFDQEDSCGASVAAWLIHDLGLFPLSEDKIYSGLYIKKNIPFLGWLDGTMPWSLARLIRSRGADVEFLRLCMSGRGLADVKFDEDERLAVALMVEGTPHWVGCRNMGGVEVADSLGMITWKSMLENRRPMLVYKVSRRLPYCPLRMA